MQYKSKPQIIEAMQFMPSTKVVNDLIQFTKGAFSPIGSVKKYLGGHLRTEDAVLHVRVGDYIIRLPNGKFTTMKKDDFKNNYIPY